MVGKVAIKNECLFGIVQTFLVLTVLTFFALPVYSAEKINSEGKAGVYVTCGYDVCYSMWNVEGFAYNNTTDMYESDDYDIDPSIINGVFISAASKPDKKRWLEHFIKCFRGLCKGRCRR